MLLQDKLNKIATDNGIIFNASYDRVIILNNIVAPGKGIKAMNELIAICDEYTMNCQLTASPKSKLPNDMKRLINFYKRFGFVPVNELSNFMKREIII